MFPPGRVGKNTYPVGCISILHSFKGIIHGERVTLYKSLHLFEENFQTFQFFLFRRIQTTLTVQEDGKTLEIEFPEVKCDTEKNTQREEDGRIRSGYTCRQLSLETVIYRDTSYNPVTVPIVYKAACELRCISAWCVRNQIHKIIQD